MFLYSVTHTLSMCSLFKIIRQSPKPGFMWLCVQCLLKGEYTNYKCFAIYIKIYFSVFCFNCAITRENQAQPTICRLLYVKIKGHKESGFIFKVISEHRVLTATSMSTDNRGQEITKTRQCSNILSFLTVQRQGSMRWEKFKRQLRRCNKA